MVMDINVFIVLYVKNINSNNNILANDTHTHTQHSDRGSNNGLLWSGLVGHDKLEGSV